MDLDDEELDVTLKEKGLRKKDKKLFVKVVQRKQDLTKIIKRFEEGETNEQKRINSIDEGTEREPSQD